MVLVPVFTFGFSFPTVLFLLCVEIVVSLIKDANG